jgi:hypothetical protein
MGTRFSQSESTAARLQAAGMSAVAARTLAICAAVLLTVGLCHAQSQVLTLAKSNPAKLVADTIENELKHANDNSKFMYKDRRQTLHVITTKEMVETTDGTVARLIAWNDQPPTAEQRAEDDAKLQNLLSDPAAMKKKRKSQDEDADRVQKMFREIPKAFIFEFAGTEPGKNGNELIKLNFKPNPKYDPPSREMTVYGAMQGSMWIDVKEERLARMEASLFRDVAFGWGILGHLDKGGHFNIEQTDLGDGRWEATDMNIQFTGKALLFKTINMHQIEKLSDFRRIPENTNLAKGIELLKRNGTSVAENATGHAAQR